MKSFNIQDDETLVMNYRNTNACTTTQTVNTKKKRIPAANTWTAFEMVLNMYDGNDDYSVVLFLVRYMLHFFFFFKFLCIRSA